MSGRKPVIAIDGPAGSGKTTVSKLLATRLGIRYVDTGAMYRAMALAADESDIKADNAAALKRFVDASEISFGNSGDRVIINSKDYTDIIRTPKASELASLYSSRMEVRERLVAEQRKLGKGGGVIMEGRDIGTVVFPCADFKFYLDADGSERAKRRHLEMVEKGKASNVDSVENDMKLRDERDSKREHSPLTQAADAIRVDTTGLSIEGVVDKLAGIVEKGR